MRIVATSDLHGNLDVRVPECDVLVIAGDVLPPNLGSLGQRDLWLFSIFFEWLESTPSQMVIWVAGNRDRHVESQVKSLSMGKITYLRDSLTDIHGLKIYGTPWTRITGQWAFSLGEIPEGVGPDGLPTVGTDDSGRSHRLTQYAAREGVSLKDVYSRIPRDTDILVTHGPPHGTCDLSINGQHIGSSSLRDRVESVQPQLLICGHIHEAYGTGHLGRTRVANVSRMDESYRPVNPPMVFEVEPTKQR